MKQARPVIFTLLILFAATHVNAQRLFFLFGHAEYASPSGDLKLKHDNGLGVELGVGVGMKKTFYTLTIGNTWLYDANEDPLVNTPGTLKYSPVKLGVRRYIFRRNLFLKADGGLATMKYVNGGSGSTHLTGSLGAGVKFAGFELIGDLTTVSGGWGSWLSIKAGMTIGL